MPTAWSRRARLRASTANEIKAIALRQITAHGPSAVSLRAIARDMGMTAPAIYRYYKGRDDLITNVIVDVYTSLADELDLACHGHSAENDLDRILAVGLAYRRWAISRPEEFRLVYGNPISRHRSHGVDAAYRVWVLFASLAAAVWPEAEPPRSYVTYEWSDFESSLLEEIRKQYPHLSPTAIALSLRLLGRMHGLVALEVLGHLDLYVSNPTKLYRDELLDLIGTFSPAQGGSASPAVSG